MVGISALAQATRIVYSAGMPADPPRYLNKECISMQILPQLFGTWRTTEAHHDTVSVTSHPARQPQGTSVQCLSSGHVWSFTIRALSSLCTISGQTGRPSPTTPGAPMTVPGKPECAAAYSFRCTYQPLTL